MQLPFFYVKIYWILFKEGHMAKNKGLTFVEKKKVVSKDVIKFILGTLFYCFAAILLGAVLVVAFGMRTSVTGVSMSPTLENGQDILVDRFAYKLLSPSRGDVVCFYPKGNENLHLYIKRVVGLPGETVQIKDGYVYIDGVRLLEDDGYDLIEDPGIAEVELKLNSSEYFVLGDDRNNSEDSRTGNIGAVSKENMLGKAWFKFTKDENTFGLVK